MIYEIKVVWSMMHIKVGVKADDEKLRKHNEDN